MSVCKLFIIGFGRISSMRTHSVWWYKDRYTPQAQPVQSRVHLASLAGAIWSSLVRGQAYMVQSTGHSWVAYTAQSAGHSSLFIEQRPPIQLIWCNPQVTIQAFSHSVIFRWAQCKLLTLKGTTLIASSVSLTIQPKCRRNSDWAVYTEYGGSSNRLRLLSPSSTICSRFHRVQLPGSFKSLVEHLFQSTEQCERLQLLWAKTL